MGPCGLTRPRSTSSKMGTFISSGIMTCGFDDFSAKNRTVDRSTPCRRKHFADLGYVESCQD